MRGVLAVISGPSGAGKTTITRGLCERLENAVLSVSVTTRPKAAKDREGVDYTFVDRAEFERMRDAGELLEHAEVFGNCYGTPRAWVEERLAEGRTVLLEIDVQGASQVATRMPGVVGIFILPPSESVLLERLRARRREDEATIQRRFAEAKREIEAARESGVYRTFIVNDDLERATAEALSAVRAAGG